MKREKKGRRTSHSITQKILFIAKGLKNPAKTPHKLKSICTKNDEEVEIFFEHITFRLQKDPGKYNKIMELLMQNWDINCWEGGRKAWKDLD